LNPLASEPVEVPHANPHQEQPLELILPSQSVFRGRGKKKKKNRGRGELIERDGEKEKKREAKNLRKKS
jgi:hypothetical protein